MHKPEVRIKEWGIYRRHLGSENPWALSGKVLDHPRFEPDTPVTTNSILSPESSELKNLHGGDKVETRNTIYILVGNNVNSGS
jgi:hypothetical protein